MSDALESTLAEVHRLRAENARLWLALEEIRDKESIEWATCDGTPPSDVQDCVAIATAALKEQT